MADEETEQELDAVMSVYGNDCSVLHHSPPHLLISLKPRTAYDISQQFVEGVLVIKASAQYPSKPPLLELKESKGLSEEKILDLLSSLRTLAKELTSNPMLVAICEAASDRITEMNQPDGDCCFCMCPLVVEDECSKASAIMKILSCFHCFHGNCFARWFKFKLEKEGLASLDLSHRLSMDEDSENSFRSYENVLDKLLEEAQIMCPVCRKSINAEDLVSVKDFLTMDSTSEENQDQESIMVPDLLNNEQEIARKRIYDELFRAQQHRGGIIEPRKLEVIIPGMYVVPPARASLAISSEQMEEARAEADGNQVLHSTTTLASTSEIPQRLSGKSEDVASSHHHSNTRSSGRPIIDKGQQNQRGHRKGRREKVGGGRTGQWIRRDRAPTPESND